MAKRTPIKILKGIAASIKQHAKNVLKLFHKKESAGAKPGYYKGRRPQGDKKE